MTGRQKVWLVGILILFVKGALGGESRWNRPTPELNAPVKMRVHRSASCSCCGKWLEHVKRHGFLVEDLIEENMDKVKDELGIPKDLRSCHTAEVSGHVVEGHVPAGDIKRLLGLTAGPYGLSVPGMPVGTPGMEMGATKAVFSVIGFERDGRRSVYSEYREE